MVGVDDPAGELLGLELNGLELVEALENGLLVWFCCICCCMF